MGGGGGGFIFAYIVIPLPCVSELLFSAYIVICQCLCVMV